MINSNFNAYVYLRVHRIHPSYRRFYKDNDFINVAWNRFSIFQYTATSAAIVFLLRTLRLNFPSYQQLLTDLTLLNTWFFFSVQLYLSMYTYYKELVRTEWLMANMTIHKKGAENTECKRNYLYEYVSEKIQCWPFDFHCQHWKMKRRWIIGKVNYRDSNV